MGTIIIGIDVQVARGCPYAVMNNAARVIDSGWMSAESCEQRVIGLAKQFPDAIFAIDAPRMPLPESRKWYWRRSSWRERGAGDRGHGRHCEVVIAAHKLANPQWTPMMADAPEWMKLGFSIFSSLLRRARCLEVFPTVSYRMLADQTDIRVDVPVSGFAPGPKDMLDAAIAARTGLEYAEGRGAEVGGGDGLGTIVLPRPLLSPIAKVLQWPGA